MKNTKSEIRNKADRSKFEQQPEQIQTTNASILV